MQQSHWQYHTFSNTTESQDNFIEFLVFDLTDVQLGRFVVGVSTTLDFQTFGTIKNIIREAIERFAIIAKPLTAEEGLEKVFAYINKHVHDEVAGRTFNDIHALLLYQENNTIHFSAHGDLKLMLIRKNHIFDVIKMTYGIPPHTHDKIFSRMYSGDITNNDHIIMTSNEAWDCFDTARLPDIVAKLPVEGAAGFLENYLPKHTPFAVGGIILGFTSPERQANLAKKHTLTPAASLDELLHTEERTSEMISPSLPQRIQKNIAILSELGRRMGQLSKKLYTKTKGRNKSRTGSTAKLKPLQHQPVIATKEKKRKPKPTPSRTRRKPFSRFVSLLTGLPQTIQYLSTRTLRLYKKWPKSTKYLLISAIVLIVIFTQSIAYTQRQNQMQEQSSFFNEQLQDIERMQTQANQSIIFKDYARARSLLIDASNAIAALPAPETEQVEQKELLREKNQQLLERANRQTDLENPTVLTTLPAAPSVADVWLFGNDIVTLSSNTLTRTNQNGTTQTITLSAPLGEIYTATQEDPLDDEQALIVLHDTDKISRINTQTGQVTEMNATIDVSTIVASNMYTNRLYVLDPVTSQIWRHQKGTASFQAGQPWLDLPIDLSQARDIVVDGTIFVLDGQDGILRFNQGVRTNFTAEKLDPPITQSAHLYTTTDSDYLFVLDQPQSRMLVFDKQGNFLQQFTSSAFTNLIGFALTESTDTITAYLLNNQTIYTHTFPKP